ncbi:MAG: DUF4912 domain-containing protein [Polyangia bacterium]
MARRREPSDTEPSRGGADSSRRLTSSGAGLRAPSSLERPENYDKYDKRERSGPHDAHPPRRSAPDLGELPETYGKDEVELLCKDPHWCFIYWEVTEAGLAAARSHLGVAEEQGRLLLRIFITSAQPGGRELRDLRDVTLEALFGRRYIEAPRPGSLVRAAVGLLSPEGLFAPIAHSSLLRVPPGQPANETSAEWLSVQPHRSEGRQRERIVSARPEPAHHERGVPFSIRGEGRAAIEGAGAAPGSLGDRLWFDPPAGARSPDAGAGSRRAGQSALGSGSGGLGAAHPEAEAAAGVEPSAVGPAGAHAGSPAGPHGGPHGGAT